MTLVSIIIPIYNVEEYLDRSLASVVNQTLGDIEIILVNDGSTDDSADVCAKWIKKDKRFIYLHQENKGVSVARNKGMLLATGDYISFLDPDDYLELSAIEKLYKYIKQHNIDMVFSGYIGLQTNGIIEQHHCTKIMDCPRNIRDFKELYTDAPATVCAKIYRKSFLVENKIQFPENLYYEDTFFAMKCIFLANKIGHINEPLYYYDKTREGSTTNSSSTKKDLIPIYLKMTEFLKTIDLFDEFYNEIKIHYHQQLFYCYFFISRDTNFDLRKELLLNYRNYYHTLFKQNPKIETVRIGVFGSYATKASLQSLFLDRNNISFVYSKNSIISLTESSIAVNDGALCNSNYFYMQCVYNDITNDFINHLEQLSQKADYLLIDFSEERYGVLECLINGQRKYITNSEALNSSTMEGLEILQTVLLDDLKNRFEVSLQSFMAKIFCFFDENKIILNEIYLSPYYGTYGNLFNFKNKDEIDKINTYLSYCYGSFKKNYPNVAFISAEDSLNYCSATHRYGLDPTNHNLYLYTNLSDKIYKIIKSRFE